LVLNRRSIGNDVSNTNGEEDKKEERVQIVLKGPIKVFLTARRKLRAPAQWNRGRHKELPLELSDKSMKELDGGNHNFVGMHVSDHTDHIT